MTNQKTYPLSPGAILLQASGCDLSNDESRREFLGDENPTNPWGDGCPAGLDTLEADRDRWHLEALRYKAALAEIGKKIHDLQAALDANQEVIDVLRTPMDWRELLLQARYAANSFAASVRRTYKSLR